MEKKNKCYDVAAIFISILAFATSILTFAIAYTRFEMPNIDTGSFLVAVLSLLVTLLLGWQIFNLFSLEKTIDNKISQSEERIENSNHQHIMILSFEFYTQFNVLSYDTELNIAIKINYLMGAITYGSKIENMNKDLLDTYTNIINHFENLLENEKENIKNLDKFIKEKWIEKIEMFPEIIVLRKLKNLISE